MDVSSIHGAKVGPMRGRSTIMRQWAGRADAVPGHGREALSCNGGKVGRTARAAPSRQRARRVLSHAGGRAGSHRAPAQRARPRNTVGQWHDGRGARRCTRSPAPAYRDLAERQIGAFGGEAVRNSIPLAAFLSGMDYYLNGVQIVIRAGRGADALQRAAWDGCLPNRVLSVLAPGEDSHPGPPLPARPISASWRRPMSASVRSARCR